MYLRLLRRKLRKYAPEPQCILAEGGPHPVVTRGGRVSLVEDEVDHLEHRSEPCFELLSPRNLEGNLCIGQSSLGSHDSLCDCRLGNEESTRDLISSQAAEQTQRKRNARLGREN